MRGFVTHIPTDRSAIDVAWQAFDEYDNLLPIGSSDSDKLIEALAYMHANNLNLRSVGGAISPTHPNANVIAFTNSARLNIPPSDSRVIEMLGVNLTFSDQGITSGTAVSINSFSKGKLTIDGQIVCNHNGNAVEARPSTYWTGDAGKNQGVFDLFIRIIEQANKSPGSQCLTLYSSDGETIKGSNYKTLELNGGYYGLFLITSPSGLIDDCDIDVGGVHAFTDTGVYVATPQVQNCRIRARILRDDTVPWDAKIASRDCDYDLRCTNTPKINFLSGAVGNTVRVQSHVAPQITNSVNNGTNTVVWRGATSTY